MEYASVAELKARLSEYLSAVKRGEEVVVTDRGRPVARLTPLVDADAKDARVAELIRSGLLRAPKSKLPPDFFSKLREERQNRTGALNNAAVDAILRERSEGW